jgi:hypothetical protein
MIITFAQRLSCTLPEASEATGIPEEALNKEIAAGRVRTVTIGDLELVVVPSLLHLLAASAMASGRAASEAATGGPDAEPPPARSPPEGI